MLIGNDYNIFERTVEKFGHNIVFNFLDSFELNRCLSKEYIKENIKNINHEKYFVFNYTFQVITFPNNHRNFELVSNLFTNESKVYNIEDFIFYITDYDHLLFRNLVGIRVLDGVPFKQQIEDILTLKEII